MYQKILQLMFIRSKIIYLSFVAFVFCNVLIFSLRPMPILRNLVLETNKKISHIKAFKIIDEETDQSYLEYLGFSELNIKSPQINHHSVVVGSAVSSTSYEFAFPFIQSIRQNLRNVYQKIVLYDIGLKSWHVNFLKKKCNKTINCIIKNFDFEKFPKHINNEQSKNYKPIIIQMLLRDFDEVVWIDLSNPQFVPEQSTNKWLQLLQNATQSGIVGWPIIWPTSSVTHPRMFDYFQVDIEKFYFHPMITTKIFVIFRSDFVTKKIMLPWIKCILNVNCVQIDSAQKITNCDFNREPYFMYSGCHWTEMSAFNIVLGLAYNMSSSMYSIPDAYQTIKHREPINNQASANRKLRKDKTKSVQYSVVTQHKLRLISLCNLQKYNYSFLYNINQNSVLNFAF